MKICNILSSLVLASAGLMHAALPTVGRVTSTEPITIRGVSVPAQSLISWPVAVNDDIATHKAPARIEFQDGSTIAIQRASKVRIEGSRRSLSVRVLEGSMVYEVGKQSHLQILNAAGKVLNSAAMQSAATTATSIPMQAATAPVYSRTAGNVGIALSPSAISTGRFLAATDTSAASSLGTKIVLPSGMEIFVTIGANNVATITRIEVPVDLPNGHVTFVTVTSGPLIGSTVNVNMSSTAPQPITITTAGGVSLDPAQTQAALQNSTAAAVHAAIASGHVPATVTPHPPAPITSGNVSPGGPPPHNP